MRLYREAATSGTAPGATLTSPATGFSVSRALRAAMPTICDCVTFAPEGGKCWKRVLRAVSLTTRARRRLRRAQGLRTLAERRLALHGAVEIDTNPAPAP